MRLFATPWTVATRLLCPWNSPGKNTGVGCHSLLQGDLPDPGIGPRSPELAGRFFNAEPSGKPRHLRGSRGALPSPTAPGSAPTKPLLARISVTAVLERVPVCSGGGPRVGGFEGSVGGAALLGCGIGWGFTAAPGTPAVTRTLLWILRREFDLCVLTSWFVLSFRFLLSALRL